MSRQQGSARTSCPLCGYLQFNASVDVELAAGDYVEMFVLQTTGGALLVTATQTYLSARFAGLT